VKNPSELDILYQTSTVNVNGVIIPPTEASISIFDRGFLYGDSIYEVTYSENGSLIFFEEHLDRLFNSAALLNMELYLSREQIVSEAIKTLTYSKLERAYIRIIVTRGETQIGLDPSKSFKNNFVIIVKPQIKHAPSIYENGLKVCIASVLRNDINAIDPNVKSGNYLNNVMAISEAKEKGFDDAIMVNRNGELTEGTTFNLWMVSNGVIYTPPKESGLLKGITRSKVIELCNENKLPLRVESFGVDEILNCDEAFITSSTKGIMHIKQINQNILGSSLEDWPVTIRLKKLYSELIQREISKADYSYL
jgi:branched-chain amino acid aminotransferase